MVAFRFPFLILNVGETCALLVWAVSCTGQALFITHRDTPLSGLFFVAETRCLPLLDDGFGYSSAQGNFVCKCLYLELHPSLAWIFACRQAILNDRWRLEAK